ncbi:hypothetical protein D3C71_1981920 [compost metagenome]
MANARVTPGPLRLRRGFLGRGGRFAFWPREGGRLELLGVFAGWFSFASSAATRSSSARISASFSCDVRRDSSMRVMDRLTHILARQATFR